MARPKKTKVTKQVEEAEVIVEETAAEAVETEVVEEVVEPDSMRTSDESEADTAPAVEESIAAEPAAKKGGFMAPFLGGVAAAALGFGAALYVFPNGYAPDNTGEAARAALEAQIKQQGDAIAALTEEVGKGADTSAISDAVSKLEAGQEALQATVDGVAGKATALDERLSQLELAPVTAGASEATVAAYERELQALQDAMAAQRQEIEDASAEVSVKKEQAEMSARDAMQHAAVSRIEVALENGTEFSGAVGDLAVVGQDVPETLRRVAETGVAPMAALQDSFPEAARAALQASRAAAVSTGDESGFVAFLKTQLGARSLEPRTGSDPDAVLSRAEAALREGRLTDTMAEIEALPEVARAELTNWMGIATTRLDALAALKTLNQSINTN